MAITPRSNRVEPSDDELKQLCSQLTEDEKISLLAAKNVWETPEIERLGVPSLKVRLDKPILQQNTPLTYWPLGNRWPKWSSRWFILGRHYRSMFSCMRLDRCDIQSRPLRGSWQGARSRSTDQRCIRTAWTNSVRPSFPTRRPELRSLFGRSIPFGISGKCIRPRTSVRKSCRNRQALCWK